MVLSLGAVGGFPPRIAAAQTAPPPQTQVSFTYLSDETKRVETVQSQYVGPGLAFVSVTASFTARGYDFGSGPGPGPDQIGPGDFGREAQISDGDAFIVTPIIDPDLEINYVLHNETGQSLTSLTFTLQPSADLYFFDNGITNGGRLGTVRGDSIGMVTSTVGMQTVTRQGFRSLTFSGGSIDDNAFNAFNFSLHVPEGQPGQGFAAVLSPGNFTPLAFPGAPEPGTLMLLLPVGIVLGAAAKVKRRKRAS